MVDSLTEKVTGIKEIKSCSKTPERFIFHSRVTAIENSGTEVETKHSRNPRVFAKRNENKNKNRVIEIMVTWLRIFTGDTTQPEL